MSALNPSASLVVDAAAHALARACADAIVPAEPLFAQFGIVVTDVGPGYARLECPVTAALTNQQGVCHGGALFTLADSALGVACNSYNERTLSSNAAIEFLRPARPGDHLIATAREQSRGKRSGIYDVRVETREGALIALFRGRTTTVGGAIVGRASVDSDAATR